MAKQEPPKLFGQAGVAAEAVSAAGKGVAVREVTCKSLLNRCGIDD